MWENNREAFHHAIRIGLGWRADCWGGRREMYFKYPFVLADVPLAWQTAPVIMEPCGVMANWAVQKSPWQKTLQWAVDNHVSELSNKSAPIPAEMMASVRGMLGRIGYRFVITQATLPTIVRLGADLRLQLDWLNEGNAPMYLDRHVLVKIGSRIIDSGVSMQGFLPGKRVDNITIGTAGLPRGTYPIQIGLAYPNTDAPDIVLAIQGEGPWYTLGSVTLRDAPQ
jgi:hypothetical protein